MAKKLTLDVTSFKFADNETDLKFKAIQNGLIVSDSTLSATIKVKQADVGYLKSISAKWVDNYIIISSGDLSDLPVGSYLLELWLGSPSGYKIYPDSGFVRLYINQNATGITGNLVSSITLGEFQQQFNDLSKDIMDNLPDGNVGQRFNTVITYPSTVTYKRNSDGTMLVTFVKNDQSQVIISYPSTQKRVPVEASYILKNSEALVYNSKDNKLVPLNFDSLLPDSLIIISNYYGKIQNNINAVQGDGDYEYYSDGTENVIYYASTVTANKNGTGIDVNFDRADTRLFYKDYAGNHVMNVANNMYTVPHNFSLTLNRKTKTLEVINTDNIIRGVHSILITCHQGYAKKVGMYFNSLKTEPIKMPTSGKVPVNRYQIHVNQDATKVGDEYWFFDGSSPDHTSTTSIHRINPTDFSEIGLISHNLGHANGVDYRDNTLLVYNGGALPPEINLYKNPDNTKTSLKIQDSANTQIIFKEGNKLLSGDGSACFGIDKKIVYYAYSSSVSQVTILKILLGLGDNDLSDKTTDKSDNKHWGTFVSGKSIDEYNGTAQIIASYTGDISGDTQPQGMAFNGDLYLGITHFEQKAYQLQLLDDGSFKVVNSYKLEMTDYKNNVISLEPEITFIDLKKRSLFIGARSGDNPSLSNVAEFNL